MSTASPALARLRAGTQASHAALEAALPFAQAGFSAPHYLRHVARVHCWLRPLEAVLWQADWPAALMLAPRRDKVRWIEADLMAGGWTAADLATLKAVDWLPGSPGPAARFGLAYVAEGATLGARHLYRRHAAALTPLPLRWWQAYGEATAPLWKNFLTVLEDALPSEADRAEATRWAAAAFDAFRLHVAAPAEGS
ncbi:Heme oxygenase [Gulbenkiania indica]|uniref:Heme oxygenase n=1 Tax=Gulbenkiania indica TaxID=375574 RepID=A0A0K6GXD5_9NEIS|nr:biliverdin-producing heme oxygenase [Gulbenkiania indica]CUA83279.1 Heme oxygenase [Gulbenkiania indica]